MQALFRILKKGGMAILQIPQDLSREQTFEDHSITDKKERARIFGQYDHVRIYGRDYFEKLRSVGFEVIEEDYTNKIAPELDRKSTRLNSSHVRISYAVFCLKKKKTQKINT